MSDITKIDTNFKVEIPVGDDNICFYDADSEPFKVYGLMREGNCYCRMPSEVAKTVNDGVAELNYNTAGGRVRFVTDSKTVHIKAVMHKIGRNMSHFSLTGSASFDMYINEGEKEIYRYTFIPPFDFEDGYESKMGYDFDTVQKRVVTINYPLYSGVKKLFIGLDKGCEILPPPDYKTEKPVVYYGSSITQGGCASRPGNSYQAIISRKFDCNYINLGFSGSAMGETEMAEYIKGLDMSVFAYDYDHNAFAAEDLRKTHKKMFDIIRNANPELPIIMLSRPVPRYYNDEEERYNIINETYTTAKASGDKNVYFIAGKDLLSEEVKETSTVDGIHPNDSGFVSMANALSQVLRDIGL